MAAQQFTLDLTPGAQVKKDVIISTPLADPTANEIWVGFGDGVATRRGNEIVNGLLWLISGIRDRKLIDDSNQFTGFDLVTAANIDILQVSDRRTSSSLISSVVAAPDLVVAMGGSVTGLTYRVQHEVAFENLIRAVQEWLHKNG